MDMWLSWLLESRGLAPLDNLISSIISFLSHDNQPQPKQHTKLAMLGHYCIGHVPPTFSVPCEFTYVGPALCNSASRTIAVPDGSLGEALHGNFLSEYTQLFALADILGPDHSGSIYIFQYRKFVSLHAGVRQSVNIPYAYAASDDEAQQLFPSITELRALSSGIMIGPAIRMRSTAENYSRYHLVEDFAAFCHALGTLEILSPRDISRFINCNILVPAPSLGLYPYKLFHAQMQILRKAWTKFYDIHFIHRKGYQRRVGGFLLERLHSYLILAALQNQNSAVRQGSQIIISKTSEIKPTS